MNQLNVNALPMALGVYEKELVSFLQPLIFKGLKSIYKDSQNYCEKNNKPQEILKKFQFFLKQVPTWSSLIIDAETDRIKKEIPCISTLMTAIFVGKVKILANIRLRGKHTNIKIKVPSCNKFIHTVYINTAEKIFYNPDIFNHNLHYLQKEENKRRVYIIIETAILETIAQMLPLQNILEEYIGEVFLDETEPIDETESIEDNLKNNKDREINEDAAARSIYGNQIESDQGSIISGSFEQSENDDDNFERTDDEGIDDDNFEGTDDEGIDDEGTENDNFEGTDDEGTENDNFEGTENDNFEGTENDSENNTNFGNNEFTKESNERLGDMMSNQFSPKKEVISSSFYNKPKEENTFKPPIFDKSKFQVPTEVGPSQKFKFDPERFKKREFMTNHQPTFKIN